MGIQYRVDAALAVITMDDSQSGNLLNQKNLEELNQVLDRALNGTTIRVILLRSNGENFCLGMDLNFFHASHADTPLLSQVVSLYVEVLKKIYRAPKPVIAVINGRVKAGGIGLISACDIVIASQESTFELSEVLLGLIPANVLPFLRLRISIQKARYLILTAACIPASYALAIGLVDEVYPSEEMEKRTKALVKRLLKAAPHAVAYAKSFTEKLWGVDLDDGCRLAQKTFLELAERPDVLAGIAAFNAGDVPAWFNACKSENCSLKGK